MSQGRLRIAICAIGNCLIDRDGRLIEVSLPIGNGPLIAQAHREAQQAVRDLDVDIDLRSIVDAWQDTLDDELDARSLHVNVPYRVAEDSLCKWRFRHRLDAGSVKGKTHCRSCQCIIPPRVLAPLYTAVTRLSYCRSVRALVI